jgi:hypothetical protein
MPLTQQYTFGGKVFGFAGQFNYLVSTRDYDIKLNPDLAHKPELVDEKIQEAPSNLQKISKSKSSLEQLASEQPKTQKEYRKLLNQYEKEVFKERQEEEKKGVVSERNYSVDSLAKKRDLAYWDSIRPVPLSLKEIEGYKRDDSLAIIEAAKKSEFHRQKIKNPIQTPRPITRRGIQLWERNNSWIPREPHQIFLQYSRRVESREGIFLPKGTRDQTPGFCQPDTKGVSN